MFAIKPINKLYKYGRYIGVRDDSKLPYLVYEGSKNFPDEIHGFKTKESAEKYLNKILNREGIDDTKLSTSQIIDLALATSTKKFQIVQYSIDDDNKLIIKEEYTIIRGIEDEKDD